MNKTTIKFLSRTFVLFLLLITSLACCIALPSCSALTQKVFPNTQALHDLKISYAKFQQAKEKEILFQNDGSKGYVLYLNESLTLIDKIRKNTRENPNPGNDPALNQAAIIEAILLTEGSPAPNFRVDDFKTVLIKEDVEPWVKRIGTIFVAEAYLTRGAYSLSKPMLQSVETNPDASLDERLYAFYAHVNGILNHVEPEDAKLSELNEIVQAVENLRAEDPLNDDLISLLAEVYSQLDESQKACEYAKASIKGKLAIYQKRAIQFIIDTDCVTNPN